LCCAIDEAAIPKRFVGITRRENHPTFDLWHLTIKQVPKRINWEEHIPQETDQWKWQMAVSSLFDERPIWPKVSISERLANVGLKFGDHMLKRYLSVTLNFHTQDALPPFMMPLALYRLLFV